MRRDNDNYVTPDLDLCAKSTESLDNSGQPFESDNVYLRNGQIYSVHATCLNHTGLGGVGIGPKGLCSNNPAHKSSHRPVNQSNLILHMPPQDLALVRGLSLWACSRIWP